MVRKRFQSKSKVIPRHRISDKNLDKSRLCDLKPGEKARVVEIGGIERFRIRLMEMGILVNDTVELDKFAPLQDPMELIVKGYHLSLRRKDAAKICVDIISNDSD
ncbi:MAG: ferrous iron transport protein A [Candidatus Marinimicrobia bacterium]|nr:ferrous iron transport protein A [Candidatus Neomarinimicrobiota bacterium]